MTDNISYEQSIVEAHSTPGLRKNQLTRESKRLNMEFDSNFSGWTKAQRDDFLDKMFPETKK